MLQHIKPVGATDSVVRQMIDLIKNGFFEPNQKLPIEHDLMKMLNVGRSTVREAKRVLTSMNLIESQAGKGSFVKEVSVLSIMNNDMFEMILDDEADLLHESRVLIETQIAMLALKRATSGDLDKMQGCVDQLQRAVERGEDIYECGRRFHQALSEASHNPVMMKVNDIFAEMLRKIQKPYYEKKYDRVKEIAVHQNIVDAIRERNKSKLVKAMNAHYEYVSEVANKD